LYFFLSHGFLCGMAKRTSRILTDEQWAVLQPLFPEPKKPKGKNKGGRPWRGNRECLEGIIWVLRSGARWRDLPPPFPSGVTCWRRLRDWQEKGVWRAAWEALLGVLDESGRLDLQETYVDATFRVAKKGATESASRSAERGRRPSSS
jgi:transposase